MRWADIMPAHHLVTLLDHNFFPKWHMVRGCGPGCTFLDSETDNSSETDKRLVAEIARASLRKVDQSWLQREHVLPERLQSSHG